MPNYNCPGCPTLVPLPQALVRGQTANCPTCNTVITHKQRQYDFNPYGGLSFVAPKRNKVAQGAIVVAQGRSPAAPIRTQWPGNNLHADITYINNLMSPAWINAPADCIRLAYRDLTPGSGQLEGFLIACPELTGRATEQLHFAKVMMQLTSAHKPTDIAEATGEAAAALCILRQNTLSGGGQTLSLAGFTMQWGMHVHSGPGIDQIWKHNNDYLIVEAKGPNQNLNPNSFMPPGFDQMNTRWVMHNLATMVNTGQVIATSIVNDLGLTMGVRWPHYGGASKNYYGVTNAGMAIGRLFGVVITAVWRPNGMLGYTYSNFRQYTNLTY